MVLLSGACPSSVLIFRCRTLSFDHGRRPGLPGVVLYRTTGLSRHRLRRVFFAMPVNVIEICLPRGSRPHLPKARICSRCTPVRPVSSCSSLATASSSSSSISTNPPGTAHMPLYGSRPRLTSSNCVLPSDKLKTTASTVTIGLGQSYVYFPFSAMRLQYHACILICNHAFCISILNFLMPIASNHSIAYNNRIKIRLM